MEFKNWFNEIGISDEETAKRLEEIKQEYFFGEDKVYFDQGDDLGYIMDTGNYDARTEGMSYGMMICVQLDMKEQFDRIWKWSKTYMFMDEGTNEGYFAWSCQTNGKKNSHGPAPDGEEYYAMALFFASHRWGDGEGIFEYSKEAKKILSAMINKGSNGRSGEPMFNADNHQILFVPGCPYTDPSYHLPHFYDLMAEWAFDEDKEFLREAAKASREYLAKACDPVTGFSSEYAEFDGSPMNKPLPWADIRHNWFYSDAYRTAANISLDYLWNGGNGEQFKVGENMQKFLLEDMRKDTFRIYEVDGRIAGEAALHPIGLLATVAETIILTGANDLSKEWLTKFYNTPLRKGERRYYDNCLYFFAFLALSGNYRVY
ncbi:MAG: glycosyl hydrolase family 8 [Lachnospiraceae bacterium]|nr:glycosyl hydrolase family 8 [Lachnospiraceae bacterium]